MSKKTVIILAFAFLTVLTVPTIAAGRPPGSPGPTLGETLYALFRLYLAMPLATALIETLIGTAFRIKPIGMIIIAALVSNSAVLGVMMLMLGQGTAYIPVLIFLSALMSAIKFMVYRDVIPEEKATFGRRRLLLFTAVAGVADIGVFLILEAFLQPPIFAAVL